MAHVSRRRFLQLAGSGLLIAQSPYLIAQPSKRKVGVALLGLGNYSTNLLAPALQHTQHCELRGIITGSEDKIPQWQKQYGIKDRNVYTYSTMADIANNDDIDVIYVVTPTGTHKDFAAASCKYWKARVV
mgnify:FL=1